MLFKKLTISDAAVPVIEDIAQKEGITFDEAVQLIWDKNAMENVRSHEQDMAERIIRGLSSEEKTKIIQDKKL